jgi:hypothetical protein
MDKKIKPKTFNGAKIKIAAIDDLIKMKPAQFLLMNIRKILD